MTTLSAPPRSVGHSVDVDRDNTVDPRVGLTRRLYERIGATDDPAEQEFLRGEVATLHLDLAYGMARRYRGRGEPDDDLQQAASVGLMKAVRGFNSDRGCDFLSYAVPTISGELKKHFRDYCWSVRPPRRIQELQAEISSVVSTLSQRLGREPTLVEIAGNLDEDHQSVSEAISAFGCYAPKSLDTPFDDNSDSTFASMVGDDEVGYSRAEVHVMLRAVLPTLSPRDREIVSLRYFHGCTQRQIAAEIGVTQMQVSRLLTRIIAQLRERLTQDAIEFSA